MSKFITNSRHKNVRREGDAGVPHSRSIEECKEVLSEESKYWTEETRQRLLTAPYWSANKWKFWQKVAEIRKSFNMVRKLDDPVRLLYFRAIQGHSGKAYSGNAPSIPNIFTKYVYQFGSGKELKSMVNNGLIPGGFQH